MSFKDAILPEEVKQCEKSAPNWREAFEQVLAAGGGKAGYGVCGFCRLLGVSMPSCPSKCGPCPLRAAIYDKAEGAPCKVVFQDNLSNSERRAICRHVLATVKDFTDRDEIRERISEMLDDPEKFLGKAEEKPQILYRGFELFGDQYKVHDYPELKYLIVLDSAAHGLKEAITAVFRDEGTRDLALKFLNAEASEIDEIRRLLNQLKSLWATL